MSQWCDGNAVKNKMKSWEGKGIPDDGISSRIDESQGFLKTKLLGGYGVSTVTGWDTTTPPVLADICAIIAAVYLKQHFTDDYKLSETEKMTFKLVDDIVQGRADILDSSGNLIGRGTNLTKFNKAGKSRTFTTGNVGDDSFGDGTLDDLGPNQSHIEGEY